MSDADWEKRSPDSFTNWVPKPEPALSPVVALAAQKHVAETKLAAAGAMIRSLEWAGGSCPECCVERYKGHAGKGTAEHLVPVDPPPHAPDCTLAALLRELP